MGMTMRKLTIFKKVSGDCWSSLGDCLTDDDDDDDVNLVTPSQMMGSVPDSATGFTRATSRRCWPWWSTLIIMLILIVNPVHLHEAIGLNSSHILFAAP